MAFQALAKYTDNPFALNRKEMNEALQRVAQDYAKSSWNAYVNCIRSFYKWANNGEYPNAVKDIKFKKIRREDYIKTKILTDQEIKALLKAAENPRDRAFIAVATATGARRGELLGLKIRDVQIGPYGYTLILTGKTGTHPSPPIVKDFAKILRVWLEHHPMRDNPEAPLWTRLRSGHWGSRNEGINRSQAHNIVKKTAKAAGIERNVHLHMFRHTENTLLTKRHVPAAARKKLHGWTPRSTVPAIYEHLTDDDAVNAALRGHGIIPIEETKDSFEPVECAYCHEKNPSEAKYCHYCGVPLDEEEAQKAIQRFSQIEEELKRQSQLVLGLRGQLEEYQGTFDLVTKEFLTMLIVLGERIGDTALLGMMQEAKERLEKGKLAK